MSDPFPIIYAEFNSFFKRDNSGYFTYSDKPKYIQTFMNGLNKDIIARNEAKKAAAKAEGRDPPKLGKGPTYGPDELEHENTTCVIQVSQGMNAAGMKVPGISSERPNSNIPGGNGFYILNVRELTNYLTYKYGPTPNLKSIDSDALTAINIGAEKPRKGILTFGTVHTEMFNGTSIVQSGAINVENGHATQPMDRAATWGQGDIRFWEIRSPAEKGAGEKTGGDGPGSFLNGWWTVYDGTYYFYYFALPYVVYTKTRPAAKAGAPWKPINRGTVKAGKENTWIVTWNPVPGETESTVETFWLIWGQTRKMNATSKYGNLYAEKITPDEPKAE